MNIKDAFFFIKQKLSKAGVDDPAFDTIYLFEHVLCLSRADITVYADKEIDSDAFDALNTLADRRICGEPIQYILGYWDFMGERYKVAKGVLIPRDDTEVLVRDCIDILQEKNQAAIIDLCSGSGIIAVTLKKAFPESVVYAVEKSDTAFFYLSQNCESLDADVNVICADLYDCVGEFENRHFDLVVSNPPYIISDEIATLQSEVQHEPRMALDGGQDGYDFYRGIIRHWAKKLKSGGHIAFEIGEGQSEYISELLKNNGFSDILYHYDLSNTVRAITAVYKS